jgi:hypothetical protein
MMNGRESINATSVGKITVKLITLKLFMINMPV